MIIYISGPISQLIEHGEDHRRAFWIAQQVLERKGHTVLNPATLPTGLCPEAYMPICMAMIDAADAVVVLPEYDGENSAGTELEIAYAKYQHKEILHTAAELRFHRSCEKMTAK